MTDPTAPGWRPEYRGSDVGDAGSGTRFGAKLYYLYRAGRLELPRVADTYAELVATVHALRGPMETVFTRPRRGQERAHRRLLEMRDEVHDVLRQTCLRMQETGAGLVQTADRYAASDEAAAAEFARLLDANSDQYRDPPPQPRPPAVDAPPEASGHSGGDHRIRPV